MTAPQLTLKSVTGVDVELQIAGPGSRSYAFVIDWHIRVVAAVGWFFAAWLFLAVSKLDAGLASTSFNLVTYLPAVIIYIFYHPVLELSMRGRTPGKRFAGVRVVTRNGEIPSAGAILIRNVFRLLDSLPVFYVVGLICVIFTRQHVRIGDLAAGTLAVIDAAESEHSLVGLDRGGDSRALNPQAFELVHELLERWSALDDATRRALASSLLTKLEPRVVQAPASSDEDLRRRLHALLAPGEAK